MTKKLLTLGILALILGGIYIPTTTAQTIRVDPTAPINPISCPEGQVLSGTPPTCTNVSDLGGPRPTSAADLADDAGGAFSDWIVAPLFKAIGALLMKLSAGILTLAGKFFDFVVNFTIIDMAKYVSNPDGLGGSISDAWRTLRDIANMLFIFVLLFVAFNAMFELNFNNVGKSVTNIIIIALLINFSLFFSKVVIDASNIVSVGFYNSIITTNTATLGSGGEGGTATVGNQTISSGYMKLLGLQSWYDAKVLVDPKNTRADQILMIGILSSIFMLIAAVILIISAIMFATRFIILVFLMILSPVAFIAYILPGQEKYAKEWWSALVNQSIFAPVFFALTWVSFKIASAPAFLGQQSILGGSNAAKFVDVSTKAPTPDSLMLVLNYVLVIGFAIGALVMAKRIASSAPGFTTISGGLGTIGAGGAALLGLSTIGFAGKKIADRAGLQEAASKKGFVGSLARATLYTSKKARSGSFDVRNAAVPTSVISDTIKGTVGRTGLGKAIGLDDVNIPNVELGNRFGKDIWGTADTKGYKERKEESEKRLRTEAAASASELTLAKAKNDVVAGSKAPAGSTSIGDMEKALASLSDKETEALVASNRELLDSQNFANAISVKQLETLNKSDQFSDEDKNKLKNARFTTLNDPDNLSALATPSAARTPAQVDAAKKITTSIKSLADSELEMIRPDHLENEHFVGQLRPAQIDAINKSVKFTSVQKNIIKEKRLKPLKDALTAGNVANIQRLIRKVDFKTLAGFMNEDGRGGVKIALDVDVLPVYTPQILRRMAEHMNAEDIRTLRDEIINTGGAPATITWLQNPATGGNEFNA